MSDTKADELKKTIERKKYPRIVNLLKKSISIITITKHILELKINLTVVGLLALVLTIENQFTKAIIEVKVMQF